MSDQELLEPRAAVGIGIGAAVGVGVDIDGDGSGDIMPLLFAEVSEELSESAG